MYLLTSDAHAVASRCVDYHQPSLLKALKKCSYMQVNTINILLNVQKFIVCIKQKCMTAELLKQQTCKISLLCIACKSQTKQQKNRPSIVHSLMHRPTPSITRQSAVAKVLNFTLSLLKIANTRHTSPSKHQFHTLSLLPAGNNLIRLHQLIKATGA